MRSGALSALLEDLARGPTGERGAWNDGLRAGDVVGRFELVREVGRGGFGVVFEARDRELGRTVAFKAVRGGGRPEVREERLLREAEAAARLSHPNIVTLHDVGRGEHGPFLVLELLRGETLARRLEQGPLALREALRIALEVSKGVAHAHQEGVVHRDLTPGNVFLCEDGQVKVLDFGMAHAFGRRRVDGGTSDYMAPEQWRGAPEDERTDVFALGVILFRMVAGELPFREGAATRSQRPRALDVPELPALGALARRMLAPDPVDRPRDAAEVLAALTAFQHELPATAADPHVRVRARAGRAGRAGGLSDRERRLLVLAVLGMAILLGAAGLGAWFLRARGAREPPTPAAAPSIAVLPFADLSPQRDQEYFSDGIAEEILNALSQVPGLRVIGRTSSFSFKGRTEDLRVIGRTLGVGSVLEGSVRRSGSRARITAQLVNVNDGFSVWSQAFDRELTDTFAVQGEIARAVVAALEVKLKTPVESASRQPTRPEAYDRYLAGRQLARQGSPEGYRRAAAAYDEAVAMDPTYAPAWAGLAYALFWTAETVPDVDEIAAHQRRALAAAERAVMLDAGLPDAWTARGFMRATLRWDWAGAQSDFERALAMNPGDVEALRRHAHFVLKPLGRIAEAAAGARKAAELDPLSTHAWLTLAHVHQASGNLEEARLAAERAVAISPTNDHARSSLGTTLLLLGRPADALRAAEHITEDLFRLRLAALAHHELGQPGESQRALDAIVADASRVAAFQIAEILAWRGEHDRAFEWLDRAYAERDTGLPNLKGNPLLRPLRSDPRFAALVKRMNLPAE